jgi:hypothetical protein
MENKIDKSKESGELEEKVLEDVGGGGGVRRPNRMKCPKCGAEIFGEFCNKCAKTITY